jgi:hypothetical protein
MYAQRLEGRVVFEVDLLTCILQGVRMLLEYSIPAGVSNTDGYLDVILFIWFSSSQ